MAREVLSDLLRASDRLISIEDIQKQVSAHYNIRANDMFSSRRSAAIARPRQIAMFLAKDLTSLSYPAIGPLILVAETYDGHACGEEN